MLEKLNQKEIPMKINPQGAKIEELVLGGEPIFYFGLRGDGKTGVTHPCTPNFGKDRTEYGLIQHGPMRDSDCKVLIDELNHKKLSYDIVHEKYPTGMNVTQDFLQENEQFILETIHTNNSGQELPVNFGEHCYFATPHGWDGVEVNGINITELVKTNGTIKLEDKNIIQIPGKKPFTLEQVGLDYAVVWCYKNEKGESDQNYICIEPLQRPVDSFGAPESIIKNGEASKTVLKIFL